MLWENTVLKRYAWHGTQDGGLSILQSSATFRACIREITATLNNVPLDFYGKIATANGLKMILKDVNFASKRA
jgi:hypothetical protein